MIPNWYQEEKIRKGTKKKKQPKNSLNQTKTMGLQCTNKKARTITLTNIQALPRQWQLGDDEISN